MRYTLLDLKISYYYFANLIRDNVMTWFINLLWPELVYWIVDNTVKHCADTIPAMSLLAEMRKRGIIEYYSLIRIMSHSTTGQYSDTVVPSLSIGDAMKRFKKDII